MELTALPDAVQIDLRFTNPEQGSLAVVVAPVLRFQDVGFNADIRIEELGPPEKLIGGFAPELFGSPLQVYVIFLIRHRVCAGEQVHCSWIAC